MVEIRGTRRTKLTAAAGLAAMALGALLVLAPAPAGAEHVDGGATFSICHATAAVGNPYVVNRPAISAQGALSTGQGDHTTHTGPVFTDGMTSGWGDIIPPYTWDGGSSDGLNWPEGHDIHANGCNLPEERQDPKASLTVVKKVTGAVPATWAASVSVDDGADGMQPIVAALSGTSSSVADSEQYATLDPDTYSVTETLDGGTFAGGVCTDDTLPPDDPDKVIAGAFSDAADLSAELTLEADGSVTCTFTNHYPSNSVVVTTPTTLPSLGTLQIVKVVTGGVPEDGWSFDFTGDLGAFALTNLAPSNTAVDLPAGSYTVGEVDVSASELVLIECTGVDAVVDHMNGAVTVELEADDIARCVFTNNYPEVLPGEVTRPTTTTTTTTEKPAEVLPGVVVRPAVLPRTGDDARDLAGLGVALLALGAVLVGASRRALPGS